LSAESKDPYTFSHGKDTAGNSPRALGFMEAGCPILARPFAQGRLPRSRPPQEFLQLISVAAALQRCDKYIGFENDSFIPYPACHLERSGDFTK
jgi:hypothetical protein